MPLGPVFAAESVVTARRARYYALRAAYGLALLIVIWSGYRAVEAWEMAHGPDELSSRDLATFATATFRTLTAAQVATLAALTPALVAGTIAGEKRRKTLLYLLASDLTDREIVLGKLAARLLHAGVFLALGLPIVCILALFGGLTIGMVLDAYARTATLTLFLAGLSAFASTVATSAPRAVLGAYLAALGLLIAPPASRFVATLWPWMAPVLVPASYYVLPLNGLEALVGERPDVDYDPTTWLYPWLQAAYGLGFIGLAVRLLRPLGRRQEGRPRQEIRLDRRGRWRWQILPRPPCGDDAMLWKERYTSRASGLLRLLGLGFNLFIGVLIGCYVFEMARASAREGWGGGGWSTGPALSRRAEFNVYLRQVGFALSALGLFGTAVVAAGSVAAEREGDTWPSLLATPLTGREIIRAKIVGSALRFRWLWGALVGYFAVGVAFGALHPLGFLLVTCELALLTWFVAALGVRASLGASSTARALALTMAVLLVLNGGYLLIAPALGWAELPWAGVMPYLVFGSMISDADLAGVIILPAYSPLRPHFVEAGPSLGLGLPLYLLGALWLTHSACYRFARFGGRIEGPPPASSFDGPASEHWARKALDDA